VPFALSLSSRSKHEILKARGFSVDKVRTAGNPCEVTERNVTGAVSHSFEEWHRILIHETRGSLAEYKTFFETMSCGYGFHSDEDLETAMPYFLYGIRSLCPAIANDKTLLTSGEPSKSSYRRSDEQHAKHTMKHVHSLRSTMRRRKFFISNSGIMDMAPAEAKVGDGDMYPVGLLASGHTRTW
jgi:hypothetical protein